MLGVVYVYHVRRCTDDWGVQVKELFRDLLVEIKALKKAPMMLKAQIAQKAVVRAAQTMESMIEEIETLQARVKELEGGSRGES